MFKRKSVLMVVVTLVLGYFLFSCDLIKRDNGEDEDIIQPEVEIVEGNVFYVGESYNLSVQLLKDKKYRNSSFKIESDVISHIEDDILHITGYGKITINIVQNNDKKTVLRTQSINSKFKDPALNEHMINNYLNEDGFITKDDILNVKEIKIFSGIKFVDDLKLFKNLEIIKIAKGTFSSIQFEDFLNLHTIEITNSSVNNFSITNLPALKVLNLQNNRIRNFFILDANSNVEFIDLSNNALNESLDFSKLVNLKELYINDNKTKKVIIPGGLEKLEAKMTELELVETFDDFSVLEYLNMKGTKAKNFVLELPTSKLDDFDVFYGPERINITIKGSHPNIKNINITESSLKRVTVFDLDNLELIKITDSSLERFDLKGNNYSSLNTFHYDGHSSEVLFGVIRANPSGLIDLNLSNIEYTHEVHALPNLKKLSLRNVIMKNWDLFSGSPNIETLRLDNTQVKFQLNDVMDSLLNLELKNSSSKYLKQIENFVNLESLKINYSELSEFDFDLNLDKLEVLDLSNNKIENIVINTAMLPQLKILDLSHNELLNVTMESEHDITTLINLSDNKIIEFNIDYPFTNFSNINLANSSIGKELNLYIRSQINSNVISDDMLKGLDGSVNIIFAEDSNFNNVNSINLTSLTKLASMELNGSFDNLNNIDISSPNFKTIKAKDELINLTTFNIINSNGLSILLDSHFKHLENISFANSIINELKFDGVFYDITKMDLTGDYTFDWYISNIDTLDSLEIVNTKQEPHFKLTIGDLPNLQILDLSKSNIKGIAFSGDLISLVSLDLNIDKLEGSLEIDTSYIINISEIKLPKVITGVLHFKSTENKFQELIFDSEISEIILEGVFNQLYTIDFGSSNNSISKLTLNGQFDNLDTINLSKKINFKELIIVNDIPSLKEFDISDSYLEVTTYTKVLKEISKFTNLELLKVYNNGSFYHTPNISSRFFDVAGEVRIINKLQNSNQNIEIYYRSQYELFTDFGYVLVKNASDLDNAFKMNKDVLFIDSENDLKLDMSSYSLSVDNRIDELFINVSEINNLSLVFEKNSSVELNLNVSTITTRTNTNLINSLNVNNLRLNIYKSLIIKPNSYTNIGSNINGADVFRAKNLDINLFANLDIRAEDGKDSNIRDFTSPGNGGTVFKVNETVNISGNYGITLKAGRGGNAVNAANVPNFTIVAPEATDGETGDRGNDGNSGGRAGYIVESNRFNVSTFKLVVVANQHGDGGNGSRGQRGQTGGPKKSFAGIKYGRAGNGGNGGYGGNGGNAYATTVLYNSKFTDINPSTSTIGSLSAGIPGKGGLPGPGGGVSHKKGINGQDGGPGKDGIIIH